MVFEARVRKQATVATAGRWVRALFVTPRMNASQLRAPVGRIKLSSYKICRNYLQMSPRCGVLQGLTGFRFLHAQ
jgi:hypothetical protein